MLNRHWNTKVRSVGCLETLDPLTWIIDCSVQLCTGPLVFGRLCILKSLKYIPEDESYVVMYTSTTNHYRTASQLSQQSRDSTAATGQGLRSRSSSAGIPKKSNLFVDTFHAFGEERELEMNPSGISIKPTYTPLPPPFPPPTPPPPAASALPSGDAVWAKEKEKGKLMSNCSDVRITAMLRNDGIKLISSDILGETSYLWTSFESLLSRLRLLMPLIKSIPPVIRIAKRRANPAQPDSPHT
eukprot:GHVQ01028782.1.p1 GENE.GHVQ01028782.1~~GHVQ01028782.1.p1  ORF type:complete len:242 (-),score=35.06 GHVQ01028782.1:212-937(-)